MRQAAERRSVECRASNGRERPPERIIRTMERAAQHAALEGEAWTLSDGHAGNVRQAVGSSTISTSRSSIDLALMTRPASSSCVR